MTTWRVIYRFADNVGDTLDGLRLCESQDEARTVAKMLVGSTVRPVDIYQRPKVIGSTWVQRIDDDEWQTVTETEKLQKGQTQ